MWQSFNDSSRWLYVIIRRDDGQGDTETTDPRNAVVQDGADAIRRFFDRPSRRGAVAFPLENDRANPYNMV
jgi:hypothetical protein